MGVGRRKRLSVGDCSCGVVWVRTAVLEVRLGRNGVDRWWTDRSRLVPVWARAGKYTCLSITLVNKELSLSLGGRGCSCNNNNNNNNNTGHL